MSGDPTARADGLVVGRNALRALHRSLLTHIPDQAFTVLQEAGFAAGADAYEAFCAWLAAAGMGAPDQLDAAHLSDTLSEFFRAAGWGSLTLIPLGGGALAIDSPDWAEAEAGSGGEPMCAFSSGLLADFLGRLSGEPVAVMEVECRGRHDTRCRFLSATPETLQRVYERMTQGRSYEEALTT